MVHTLELGSFHLIGQVPPQTNCQDIKALQKRNNVVSYIMTLFWYNIVGLDVMGIYQLLIW